MGCDGGTIPTRGELVRLKKKPEKKDEAADLAAKWRLCALTQEPLQQPIVACGLGRLYKKESVIELLLDRSKFECAFSFEHLKGLKDVTELVLTENSAYKEPPKGDKGNAYVDRHTAPYICPVTGLEMSGKYRFIFLAGCGCVFAERALKEIKAETCHKCGKQFRADDIVILNGTDGDVAKLMDRMVERKQQAKLAKKSKKHKAEATVTSGDQPTEDAASSTKKARVEETPGSSNESLPTLANGEGGSKLPNGAVAAGYKLANGAAASSKLTNGATAGSKLANGATAGSKLINGATASSSKGTSSVGSRPLAGKKSSTGPSKGYKSVQKDPRASETFKGLFTTSAAAKRQPKAHWVTYNPQYN